MSNDEFYYLFLPLLAFVVVLPLVGLHEWKKERENSSSEPITMYIRYPDHTVEEMQVHNVCNLEKALKKHLTTKLATEPDTDVSQMLVYYAHEKRFWKLWLFSVSKNPAGKLTISHAIFGLVDIYWDNPIDALENPGTQLDAVCAMGYRLQDVLLGVGENP